MCHVSPLKVEKSDPELGCIWVSSFSLNLALSFLLNERLIKNIVHKMSDFEIHRAKKILAELKAVRCEDDRQT
jgi:hypothetical protein